MVLVPQKQPNAWSCLITSFAMVTGISVDFLLTLIPDGGKIVWPDNEEPYNRRGNGLRDIQDALDQFGFLVMSIDAGDQFLGDPVGESEYVYTPKKTIFDYMWKFDGVLGTTKDSKCTYRGSEVGSIERHAFAWDHQSKCVINPTTGEKVSYGHFTEAGYEIESFFVVAKVVQPLSFGPGVRCNNGSKISNKEIDPADVCLGY